MRKMGGKKGFTLVELALAVGFIALLSLTITLIINDTVETYRRGITLNQINTTGMDLVDDFRAAIQNSPARQPKYDCEALFMTGAAEACFNDNASSLISLTREALVDTDEDDSTAAVKIPVYGAICTGAFSYIWNSGYFFGENAGKPKANMDEGTDRSPAGIEPAKFVYNGNGGTRTMENFRLLKVKDDRRGVCRTAVRNYALSHGDGSGVQSKNSRYRASSEYVNDLSNVFDVTNSRGDSGFIDYFTAGFTEQDIEVVLDDNSTNPLALYDFSITTPATTSSGEAAFYSSSFILGTLTGGIDVKAKGNFCKAPEDYIEDFDYCAINKFNFAAQATGG